MARRLGRGHAWAALAGVVVLVALAGGFAVGPQVIRPPGGTTAVQASVNPLSAGLAASDSGRPSMTPTNEPVASVGPAAPTPSGPPAALAACPAETARFPSGYGAYHTDAELCRAVVAAAAAHPDIARLHSIGTSAQGRQILAMEISAHLTDGTHPPGVLFEGGTHGLEHLSVEMPLAIMGWLLDGYGTDSTVTRLVQTRAIFLVFDVNPDGAAFDIDGGRFHEWRKNRQPNADGTVGTDLNRNYDDHWGCCGLVSARPGSSYYRGAQPFSAPETQAVRDFVEAHVFGGEQEIRAAISFHASGRLILWPYGYTPTAVPAGMSGDEHAVLEALAKHMAKLDGYRAEQASSLYVDSGTARDWYFGEEGILAFTVELGTGTYQRSGVIASETARNRSAVLYLIEMAGCPDRARDPSATACG